MTEPSRNSKEPGHRIYWKLADFGVAKTLTREVNQAYNVAGVPVYLSPEVLNDLDSYSAASDIWSLGCVTAFYMRGGKHVFKNKDDVLNLKSDSCENVVFSNDEARFFSSLVQLVLTMLQVRFIDILNMCTCLQDNQSSKKGKLSNLTG